MHRCPQAVLQGEPELLDFVASIFMVEHGVLPASGGWYDQSAWWCAAMMQAAPFRAECEQWKIEQARKKAETEARSRAHSAGGFSPRRRR